MERRRRVLIWAYSFFPEINWLHTHIRNLIGALENSGHDVLLVVRSDSNVTDYLPESSNVRSYPIPHGIFMVRSEETIMSLLEASDHQTNVYVTSCFEGEVTPQFEVLGRVRSHRNCGRIILRSPTSTIIENSLSEIPDPNALIDYYVSLSQFMDVELCEAWADPRKIRFVPNATHIHDDLIDRKMKGIADRGEFRFLYAGRFIKRKRLDRVLRAFRLIERRFQSVGIASHLELVWYLSLEDCKEFVHEKNVSFHRGTMQIDEHFSSADFIFNMSDYEWMSNSLLEWMSYGCIPICTKIGGNEDIVKDGINGFIGETEEGLSASIFDAVQKSLLPNIIANIKLDLADKFSISKLRENFLLLLE